MTSTDVSPAAVAAMLSYLRGACVGMGEEADFIQGLADKLSEAEQEITRLGNVERLMIDELSKAQISAFASTMTLIDSELECETAKSKAIDELAAANAEIARLRQQIAWFQAEAAKPPFRIEADFSPPLQETTK